MSEKPEESFDGEGDEDAVDSDDLNLDEIIRDLDPGKRKRGAKTSPVVADPAWRKLERYLEERRTAEQLSDFDDYDIDDAEAKARARTKRKE